MLSKSGIAGNRTKYGIDRFVSTGGYRVHYVETGQGEPVILVPGSISTHRYYSNLAPMLAKSYRVFGLDCIGTGESDKPGSGFGYSVHDQADIIAKMVIELGLGKVNLVGSSYGGVIVFSLATRYPEIVNKVVSIEGGVVKLERFPKNPIEGALGYPVIGNIFVFLVKHGFYDDMMLKVIEGAWYPKMTAEEKLIALEQLHFFFDRATRHAWHLILASYKTRKDFHEEAKALRCPILYVYGARSAFGNVLVERNIEFFHRYLPHAQIVGFEDGVHDLANQKPQQMAHLIINFFAGQNPPMAQEARK
jgi:pimeloyl-ACP methyl ester carboxylesterase